MPNEPLIERMLRGDHDTDGSACWCQPRIEPVNDGDGEPTWIILHRRFHDDTLALGPVLC
jgi:hypothetical protein